MLLSFVRRPGALTVAARRIPVGRYYVPNLVYGIIANRLHHVSPTSRLRLKTIFISYTVYLESNVQLIEFHSRYFVLSYHLGFALQHYLPYAYPSASRASPLELTALFPASANHSLEGCLPARLPFEVWHWFLLRCHRRFQVWPRASVASGAFYRQDVENMVAGTVPANTTKPHSVLTEMSRNNSSRRRSKHKERPRRGRRSQRRNSACRKVGAAGELTVHY